MALNGFVIDVRTGNKSGAGTDGDVYLGLGGREFYLDSVLDDFETGEARVYVYGSLIDGSPNPEGWRRLLIQPEHNDPRTPALEESDVNNNPVYIRFVPKEVNGNSDRDDNWQLGFAQLTLDVTDRTLLRSSHQMAVPAPIWLGTKRGEVVHFRR